MQWPPKSFSVGVGYETIPVCAVCEFEKLENTYIPKMMGCPASNALSHCDGVMDKEMYRSVLGGGMIFEHTVAGGFKVKFLII
jgi:hypothetical protein